MLKWSADSLVSSKHQTRLAAPLTVRELVQYGWMTYHAQEVSHVSMIAVTVDGEGTIVLTIETLVHSVLLFAWQMAMLAMAAWRSA